MKTTAQTSLLFYLVPKYWLTWLGLGCLWLMVQLPYSTQLKIGRFLGICSYHLLKKRRHIAEVNVRLCFPELTTIQQKKLVRENFASLGIGLLEMGMSWWASSARINQLVKIKGAENLAEGFAKGKGIIMLGAHFTSLDLVGRLFIEQKNIPFDILYRPSKNKLINTLLLRRRKDAFNTVIEREGMRAMIRQLQKNRAIWYAPDQDYGRKHSIFVPFFGITAATITATARLAKLTGASIVPAFQYRLSDAKGYEAIFHPPLLDFPSGDDEKDALRINKILEEAIRRAPEQYLWAHRRFKTRPEGETRPY